LIKTIYFVLYLVTQLINHVTMFMYTKEKW